MAEYFLHRDFLDGHSESGPTTCGLPADDRRFVCQPSCIHDASPVWQKGVKDLTDRKLFHEQWGGNGAGLIGNQTVGTFAKRKTAGHTESRSGIFTSRSIAEIHEIRSRALSNLWSAGTWCLPTMISRPQANVIQNVEFQNVFEDSTCSDSITFAAGSVDSGGSKRRRSTHQRYPEPISDSGDLAVVCSKGEDSRKLPECVKAAGGSPSPPRNAEEEERAQEDSDDDDESEYGLRRQFPFFLRY